MADLRYDDPLVFQLNSAAGTNRTTIKAGRTMLCGAWAYNANAAVRYLKIYDKGSAIPEPASDRPVLVLPIPALGLVQLFPGALYMPLNLGLGISLVTGAADTDATAVAANDIKVVLAYL
jgi:hypothetical protein